MPTPYETLYKTFARKIKSYDWLTLTEEEITDIITGYMESAIANYYTCKMDLNKRNDELECFDAELTLTDVEILTDYMIVEWIDSEFICTSTALKQRMTSKDYHNFSPANHLDKLILLHSTLRTEAAHMMSVHSYCFGADDGYKKSVIRQFKKKRRR